MPRVKVDNMAAIAKERVTPALVGVWSGFRSLQSHFVLRRIAKAIFTIWFVTSLIFFLVRLLPGSPVEVYINTLMGQYGYTYDVAADQARSIFSVDADKPLAIQYVDYLTNVAQGDLGQSFLSPGVPVTEIIYKYLWWTLFSVGIGLLIAFTTGVVFGMIMAYRRNTAIDNIFSVAASLFHSVPSYLFGIMVVVFFGVRLDWLPIANMRGSLSSGQQTELSFAF